MGLPFSEWTHDKRMGLPFSEWTHYLRLGLPFSEWTHDLRMVEDEGWTCTLRLKELSHKLQPTTQHLQHDSLRVGGYYPSPSLSVTQNQLLFNRLSNTIAAIPQVLP